MAQETATVIIGSEEERAVEAQILDRRAQFASNLTKYIAWGAGIDAVVALILWALFPQYTQFLPLAILLAQLTVAMAVYPVFHRKGRGTAGALLALSSLLFACAVVYVVVPEGRIGVLGAFSAVILAANLILGKDDGRWLAGISVLLLIADVILAQVVTLEWVTPMDGALGMFARVLFAMVSFVVIAAIAYIVVAEQEKFFRVSKLAGQDIKKRVVAEQEQRKHLEQANREIEKRAATEQEQRENLQHILDQVREAANNLSAAAAEILAATTQQASGASEQSAAISQTTTTVDEVRTVAEQSVIRAQEVTNSSQRTVEVSQAGRQAVQDTIASMEQIKARVEGIAENILALSEQTQQIGEIIATVNEIAAQSNILALNASVEAARAGEHGKGFAVVAVEVRNLAEQSKQATAQVKAILSDIQNGINATVMATEEGTKVVDEGVQLTAQTQEVIAQLSSAVEEASQAATQVMAGGQQQASGVEQIAMAMGNINQATVQSLASTRQSERAARDLSELARSLTEIVAQYQL